MDMKLYRRNCLLGAIGAALMAVGDLCLSIIPAGSEDNGLFIREAYLSGEYQLWRPAMLLVTGLIGMFFYTFGIRALHDQILPECRISRATVKYCGLGFVVSGAAFHFLIGSLSYWTAYLSPVVGREQTIKIVTDYYDRFVPTMLIVYIPIVALMLTSLIALLRNKTIMPRWSAVFHIITWQIILAGIPDIRQIMGAQPATIDYMMSQSSGNVSVLIWLMVCFFTAKKRENLLNHDTDII